jgi:hypothetical protein
VQHLAAKKGFLTTTQHKNAAQEQEPASPLNEKKKYPQRPILSAAPQIYKTTKCLEANQSPEHKILPPQQPIESRNRPGGGDDVL